MVIRFLDQFTCAKRSQAFEVVRMYCPKFSVAIHKYMCITHNVMSLLMMHSHAAVNLCYNLLSISISKSYN